MRFFASLAALACALPAAAQTKPVALANGLTILVAEDHRAPTATIVLVVKAGSRDERLGETGLAHLVEHLALKGTRAHPKLMEALDELGGRYNASTTQDLTTFYATVPADKLEVAAQLFAELLSQPRLDEKELPAALGAVKEELARDAADPETRIYEALYAHAFRVHPYHHPVAGWPGDLDRVTIAQARAFAKSWYAPANATLAIVGDVAADKGAALAKRIFGALPSAKPPARVALAEPPQDGVRRIEIHAPAPKAVLGMAWRAPAAGNPDALAVELVKVALAGRLQLPGLDALPADPQSRLGAALLGKGLATSFTVEHTPSLDPGLFAVFADPAPGADFAAVEAAIRAETARLAREPLSDIELARVKERALACAELAQDGTAQRALALAFFGALGDPGAVTSFAGRVMALGAADLTRAAKRLFVDDGASVVELVPSGPAPAAPKATSLLRFDRGAHAASPADLGPGAAAPAIAKRTLGDGLAVVAREEPGSPTFALELRVRAGTAEDGAHPGVAALAAELWPRAGGDAAALFARGATFAATAEAEAAVLTVRGRAADLDAALDLAARALARPKLSGDDVAAARERVLARARAAEADPAARAARAFGELLYAKESPLRDADLDALAKSLGTLDASDVAAFYAAHYAPDRAVLAAATPLSADALAAALEKRLAGWKKPEAPPAAFAAAPAPQGGRTRVVFLAGARDAVAILGAPSTASPADPAAWASALVALRVVRERLVAKLRNKDGFASAVATRLVALHGGAPALVVLSTTPQNAEDAAAGARELLGALARSGPTDEELRRAKAEVASELALDLDTQGGRARRLAELAWFGREPGALDGLAKQAAAAKRRPVADFLRLTLDPAKLDGALAGALSVETN